MSARVASLMGYLLSMNRPWPNPARSAGPRNWTGVVSLISAVLAWCATALVFLFVGDMDMTCKVDERLIGFSAVSACAGVVLSVAALVIGFIGLFALRRARGGYFVMGILGVASGVLPLILCALMLLGIIFAISRAC